MLKHIDRTYYETEVVKSAKPVLLCFSKKTLLQNDPVIALEELSQQFDSIEFFVIREEDHDLFHDEFHFLGTPIFIVVQKGLEKGRLLGSVSTSRLRNFLETHITELKAA